MEYYILDEMLQFAYTRNKHEECISIKPDMGRPIHFIRNFSFVPNKIETNITSAELSRE